MRYAELTAGSDLTGRGRGQGLAAPLMPLPDGSSSQYSDSSRERTASTGLQKRTGSRSPIKAVGR
jgi:hypothetical protein